MIEVLKPRRGGTLLGGFLYWPGHLYKTFALLLLNYY